MIHECALWERPAGALSVWSVLHLAALCVSHHKTTLRRAVGHVRWLA